MTENGYENLMHPGGLKFAIDAVKVSVPEEKQHELILHIANIVVLVIDYYKQQNPPAIKKILTFEMAEKIAKEEQLKKEIQESIEKQELPIG